MAKRKQQKQHSSSQKAKNERHNHKVSIANALSHPLSPHNLWPMHWHNTPWTSKTCTNASSAGPHNVCCTQRNTQLG